MLEKTFGSFVSIIEDINLTVGLILCSFLLFCLMFRTKHDLGQYRYLQRILSGEGVFAMVATTDIVTDKRVICAYTSFYTLTFVMIDYNFLYRMWAVKSHLRVRLFSSKSFICLLFLLAILQLSLWFASIYYLYVPTDSGRARLRESALDEYGIDTTVRVMVMGDYFLTDGSYSKRHVGAVCCSCAIMAVCFGFMIYAMVYIVRELRRVSTIISKKTLRLQRQLFATLCLQTLIPFIFLYAPCGLNILLPMARIDAQSIARVTPILISCFLPCDSLATILSMTEYRRELISMLKFSFSAVYPAESVETNTRNSNSVNPSFQWERRI